MYGADDEDGKHDAMDGHTVEAKLTTMFQPFHTAAFL